MTETLLAVNGVTKSFGGNRAVEKVSFALKDYQTAIGLVGPNGAGKSTLLNIIAGTIGPDSGEVFLQGERITSKPSWARVSLGISKTFQIPRPLKSLTVRENVYLFSRADGGRRSNGVTYGSSDSIDGLLKLTHLSVYAERYPTELPFGLLKYLELAKALATRPKLLLLDEPIGGLSRSEATTLIALLRELASKGELRMVIVEHRLSELFSFVQSVIALDKGQKIFDGSVSDFFKDSRVSEAYLGNSAADAERREALR